MIELWLMTEKDREVLEAEINQNHAQLQRMETRILTLEAAVLALGGTLDFDKER